MDENAFARIEAEHAARRKADREIPFLGETLTVRPSVPYLTAAHLQAAKIKVGILAAAQAESDGDQSVREIFEVGDKLFQAQLDALQAAEDAILDCLDPCCHEAWVRLRAADSAEPLTGDEMFDIADYLIGLIAEIPTSAPIDSADGRTKTARSSKDASSSPAKIRAVSG